MFLASSLRVSAHALPLPVALSPIALATQPDIKESETYIYLSSVIVIFLKISTYSVQKKPSQRSFPKWVTYLSVSD